MDRTNILPSDESLGYYQAPLRGEALASYVNRCVSAFLGPRRRLGRAWVLLVLLPALVAPRSAQAADDPLRVTAALRDRSISAIRQALDREHRFVKVHAAEYLLSLGYAQGVKEAFTKELQKHGDELQYRVGIWRVLARCDTHGPEQSEWTGKIREVLRNPSAPDRVHAAETLAKLGCRIGDDEAASLEGCGPIRQRPADALRPVGLGQFRLAGRRSPIGRPIALLEGGHASRRGVCAASSAGGFGGDGREAAGSRPAGAAGIEGQGLPRRGGGDARTAG